MGSDGTIDDLVRNAMRNHAVVGASVSIIIGNEPVALKHFGFSDKANKILVNDSTLFKIGSITKVFTASAVMQLVEQNKIDVDKPIKEYLPEFSVKSRFESSNPITIRDILCHHSGLPCDNLNGYFTENLEAFHSIIPFLNNAYTVCQPGQMFYYSNVGYELLGILVSRISGLPFHEYIDTVFLNKNGMYNSAISLSDEKRNNLSKPYRKGKEQVETMMKGVPEGGIHSTASDMAIFMDSLLNSGKNIFNHPDTLEAMLTPQYPGNPMDMSFVNGLGWFIGKPGLDHGGKVIWHDGGTPNFFSLMVLIPQRKLGLTILTNSSTGALMNHTISVEILRLLLNENHRITVPTSQEMPHPDISPQKMRSMTGRFYSISGIINVFISGKHLIAKLPSGIFRLKPHSDGWFGVLFMLFGFFPLNLKKLAMVRIGVPEINGEKVFAFEQLGFRSAQGQQYRTLRSSEIWKQRTGEYVCVNEKNPRLKSFKLIDTPDGLALSAVVDKIGRLKLFLDVVNDSEAITVGFGRYTGETIHGFEDTLTVFGIQFKKSR
jgi:CubicO group peptidase (beta-lactamase class C family)